MSTGKRLDALEVAAIPVCERCGQPLSGAALDRARRAEKWNVFNGNQFAEDFSRLVLGDDAVDLPNQHAAENSQP
jgi:hypothetical protein